MSDAYRSYIGGEWLAGGDEIAVENPGTGEVFAAVARAGPDEVDRAVAAARTCVADRRLTDMRPSARGRLLVDMARWIRDHEDEIVEVLTLDSGKTLLESRWEVAGGANFLEYYGGLADKIEGSYIPLGAGYIDYVTPVPYGVSAHIVPWNYPFELTCRGIGPALAAGNAVVVKSPELAPLSVTYVARAAEAAGMPRGAVNVMCGYGHDAGEALARHPGIDQITFTGSVETGRKILYAAAESVIPAVVELGGKSAGIVLDDADLDQVTDQTRWGIFSNSGQVCSALARLVVPARLHDEVVDRLVTMAGGLTVGPGIEGTDMGSLISGHQLEQVDRHVRAAGEDGASAAIGGERIDRLGHFYQPTIFPNVTNDMAIARDEVFGPVLSVIPYGGVEEALRIANDSDYGLVAGVFGNDLDQATFLADRLEAGQIFVNEWFQPSIEAPFGGFKRSGFGREKGADAVRGYYQLKNINISRGS
ncbi:MAG: aldehyde dehydrogenase family protein [Acidimicrobiia bacterium]|nr:aldehyde dehydrogenase family protein [Acidimicrobiia bacterium]